MAKLPDVATKALRRARIAGKRLAYSGFGRDRWQQPDRVVAELGLRPGDRVADLGAGGGYFTFRLARAVLRRSPTPPACASQAVPPRTPR